MKVLLVDDEFNARRTIRKILSEKYDTIDFLSDASSVEEAIIQINEESPDIIFLDIQLGDKKSFEIFSDTDIKGQVIFVTAYDTYALEAFKHDAVNYILKPVEREQIYAAFEKAIALTKSYTSAQQELKETLNNNGQIQKLILPGSKEAKVINISTITYIKAEGVYCRLFFDDKNSILCAKPLIHIEEKLLNNENFIRTHKSYMINLEKIVSVGGDTSFISVGADELIPVSRSRKENVKKILNDKFY